MRVRVSGLCVGPRGQARQLRLPPVYSQLAERRRSRTDRAWAVTPHRVQREASATSARLTPRGWCGLRPGPTTITASRGEGAPSGATRARAPGRRWTYFGTREGWPICGRSRSTRVCVRSRYDGVNGGGDRFSGAARRGLCRMPAPAPPPRPHLLPGGIAASGRRSTRRACAVWVCARCGRDRRRGGPLCGARRAPGRTRCVGARARARAGGRGVGSPGDRCAG